MRSLLSIFFFIAFASFLFLAGVSQAASVQDAENLPARSSELDIHDHWKELTSFLNPTKFADQIRNLFVSGSMENADMAPPQAQGPDSMSENIKQSLEALFSEETSKIVRSFEMVINSTTALGRALNDALESMSSEIVLENDIPLTPLSTKIATFVAITRNDFRARFPLPAMAPGHAERVKHVSEILQDLQQFVLRLAKHYKIKQETIEHHLARADPLLHEVWVFSGDVAELYPAAIEALVLNISAMLLPEAVYLRSLLILYCFGPYVLGKDAIGGWLSKHVSV